MMGEWTNEQSVSTEPQAWYVEYGSGYCTVVMATSRPDAKRKAGRSRVPGDWHTRVRVATEDDLADFLSMGGTVR